MATIKFSSKGCTDAANSLRTSAKNLDTILNEDLTSTIGEVKNIYHSATADELYVLYDKLRELFPELTGKIEDCAKYLSETVAPAYEKVENKYKSQIR